MFRSTVLLCAIAVQGLSAPNPNGIWIDYHKSYKIYDPKRMPDSPAQQETARSNKLGQQSVDYMRPGNWTEHNEYRTDGGAGRVTEEEGQIVTGLGRVQYYQKHSSSSYGVNADNARSPNYGDVGESILASQNTIGSASGLERVGHRRSSSNSANDPQVRQRRQSSLASKDGNWHTSNSWKTDDGRGVVHEEQGQVVDGPAQIQYYRKNYSSSYSLANAGSAVQQSFSMTIHRSTVGQKTHGTSGVDEGHLPASRDESAHDQHRATSHHGAVVTPSSNLTADDTQHTSGNSGSNQQRPHRPHSGDGEFDQHTENDENWARGTSGFGNYPQETSDNLPSEAEKHQPGMTGFREEATTAIPRNLENTEVEGENPRTPAPKPTRKHTQSHLHPNIDANIPHSNTEVNIPHINNPHSNIEANIPHVNNPDSSIDANIPYINNPHSNIEANIPHINNPHSNIEANIPHTNNPLSNTQLVSDIHGVDHPKNIGKVQQENLTPQSLEQQDNSAVPETKRSGHNSSVQGEDHSEPKLNHQLIVVYGGNRPYNAKDKDDIGNANINPSATFAPNPNQSKDSWDVAVKPIEKSTKKPIETPVQELDSSTIFPTDAPDVTTTPNSRWWDRITKTVKTAYKDVKEAVKDIYVDTKNSLQKL